MSDGQDWGTVQIGGGRRRGGGAAGGAGGPSRPHASAAVIAAAKLDAADAPTRPKYFSLASVTAIQAYRRENALTQRLMDGRCGFPAGRCNALEARNSVPPSSRELQVLNNLLRTRLVLE